MAGNTDTPFHCDIRNSFAKAFNMWRIKNQITLKQIAADLGVAVSTVSSWELGKRFPSEEHFQALVNYTRLPPLSSVLHHGGQMCAGRLPTHHAQFCSKAALLTDKWHRPQLGLQKASAGESH